MSEELLRQKHLDNSTLDKDKRFAFIAKWEKDHRELLIEQLGPKCVDVNFYMGSFLRLHVRKPLCLSYSVLSWLTRATSTLASTRYIPAMESQRMPTCFR